MNLNPTPQSEKYFGFPQEIVLAQLKNYRMKILNETQVSLVEDKELGQVCFVKLYLFENEFIKPLEKHLKS